MDGAQRVECLVRVCDWNDRSGSWIVRPQPLVVGMRNGFGGFRVFIDSRRSAGVLWSGGVVWSVCFDSTFAGCDPGTEEAQGCGNSGCDIGALFHDAMASRIVSMIRRVGVNKDVVMIGGVGYNPGFVEAMKRELKLEKMFIPEDPEFGAAVGAAVVAAETA